MNYYLIGYHSYEECPEETLIHEEKFTSDDIENMLVEYIKSRKDLPDKKWDFRNQLSDIIFDENGFIKFLCEKKGFERLKYGAIYKAFGWASVFDATDWESESKDLNSLRIKLKESDHAE